jgi:hypothetical protein
LPGVGNTLGGCASQWCSFVWRWQHARGLRLTVVFIRPTSATRSGAAPHIGVHSPRRWQHARGLHLTLVFNRPVLATRSGATPRIGIPSPDVGNTLEGCALQPDASSTLRGYAYMLTLAFALLHPASATRSGAAPYAVTLSSFQCCKLYSVYHADAGSMPVALRCVRSTDTLQLHSDSGLTYFG